jgi:hypothetical protein
VTPPPGTAGFSCRPAHLRGNTPLIERVFRRVGGLDWPGGCRARRPRRARAQPQGHHRPASAQRADLRHRPLGVREVVACVRHDLRRRAATLRRVALRLRAAVLADDGEARRRLDRRPLPGDLHRPEDDVAKPAFDRRDGDRDLRLPPAPLRASRPAALSHLRASDRRPVRRVDRRPDPSPARRHEVHGQRAGRPRPEGRVPRPARAAARRGLHARERRRKSTKPRRGDRARQEAEAHDRGRRRPARHEVRPPASAHGLHRDCPRPCRRARDDRRRRGRLADVLGAVRLPGARRWASRAPAARLLLQLTARSLPALHGARGPARDRPRPPRARPVALDRRGSARAVVRGQLELLRIGHPGDRRPVRDRPRHAVERAPASSVATRRPTRPSSASGSRST